MKRKPVGKIIVNILVILLCCVWLVPVYMVIVNAFKSRAELYENIFAFPKHFTLEYFQGALKKMDFLMAFKNSIIVTVIGLIFMYVGFGAGMGVFLFHGFIKSSVPVSLEEAAIIDGCNTWQLFWRIVFPILKSITVTVIILDVIWIWNDYLLPSLTLTSIKNKTIPLAMSLFFGQYTIEWNMAMAALTFTIIPVIIFYLLCQKHIIKGVAAGAVKG